MPFTYVMATTPGETLEKIAKQRRMSSDPADPIHSENRDVRDVNGSLYANITSRAADLMDVDGDDAVTIHSYRGFVVITPCDEDDEQ